METASLGGSSINRSGSFRKRPLEERRSDGTEGLPPKHCERSSPTDMDVVFPSSKQSSVGPAFGGQQIHDEVEQHFLRSLAQVRTQQTAPQVQGSTPLPATLQPSPSNEQQNHTSSHHSGIPQPSQPQSQPHHHHHHHDHKQLRQQPPQPSQAHLRTILPKPHPSDTHEIFVTENAIPAASPQPPQAILLPTTASLGSQSVTSTPVQLPKTSMATNPQPIFISTSQGPQIISTAGGMVIPTATQGVQIIDFTQHFSQKYATSNGTSPQKVVSASPVLQTSLPNMVSVSQVPNIINLSQGNLVQVTKAPVMAIPTMASRLPGGTSSVVSGGVTKVVTATGGLIQSPRKQGTTTFTTTSPSLFAPQVPQPVLAAQQPTMTITSQSATPSMLPIFDPSTAASQLVTTGDGQLILLPGNIPLSVPNLSNLSNLSGQTFVLVNPSDLSQPAAVPTTATTANQLHTTSFINPMGGVIPGVNPGGYIVLHPGAFPNTAPIINLTGGRATSVEQQQQLAGLAAATTLAQSITPAPSASFTSAKSAPSSKHSPHNPSPPKVHPLHRVPRDGSPDNIMTPATVEDHFAKALGEQWSQLKTNLQPHSQAIVAENTVAS